MSYEQDYIMRIVKEMARVIMSVALGKSYESVEMELDNKYVVSRNRLDELLHMADEGRIEEAENMLLEDIDYSNSGDVSAAVLFYQHLSEKSEKFLTEHGFSSDEVVEGMKNIAENAGCGDLMEMLGY